MTEPGKNEIENAAAPAAEMPPSPGVAESAATARSRRFALRIVSMVMFIDLLGFGIVLPLLPRFGREFLEPVFPGDSPLAVGLRYGMLGLLMSSFSLMQFIFAPIWGRMSDWKGRRPFLLLGLAGSVVFYALFGFASGLGASGTESFDLNKVRLGLVLLFVTRIGAGIAGATVSTAQAVIADSTPPERRSHGMALIGFAFGLGFTFGPAIGAGALKIFQTPSALGYVASGICFVALILGITLMPETVRPGVFAGRRAWFNWSGFQLALRTPTVGLLIAMFFLSTLAFGNFEATLAFLTKDLLHYGEKDNFLIFMYVGFVLSIAQGVLYRPLARRGVTEIAFTMAGGTLLILGLGGIGLVILFRSAADVSDGTPFAAFIVTATAAVVGFAFVTPSVQSLVSRRSDPTRQGEILGVNQSVNALSRILAPVIASPLYGLNHAYPYATAVLLIGVMLLAVPRVREVHDPTSYE